MAYDPLVNPCSVCDEVSVRLNPPGPATITDAAAPDGAVTVTARLPVVGLVELEHAEPVSASTSATSDRRPFGMPCPRVGDVDAPHRQRPRRRPI
jgi:hypothetical protein